MTDFPIGLPDIPDSNVSETLSVMHAGAGHVAGTNRILLNVLALAAKIGIGASTPGAAAGLLRRTGSGSSAWGAVQAGDYAPLSIGNADIATAANIAVAKIASIGSGNVLKSNGVNNVVGPVLDAEVGTNAAIGVSKIAHVGSGNVLKSNGTINVAGQVANADLAGLIAAAKLSPGAANTVLGSNGTVNSFGSVVTAMIAANAISGVNSMAVNTPTLVNTASVVAIAGSSFSFTAVAGSIYFHICNIFGLSCNVGYPGNQIVMYLDGASNAYVGLVALQANLPTSWSSFTQFGPAAGTHTVDIRWQCPNGASTMNMTQLIHYVVELKR